MNDLSDMIDSLKMTVELLSRSQMDTEMRLQTLEIGQSVEPAEMSVFGGPGVDTFQTPGMLALIGDAPPQEPLVTKRIPISWGTPTIPESVEDENPVVKEGEEWVVYIYPWAKDAPTLTEGNTDEFRRVVLPDAGVEPVVTETTNIPYAFINEGWRAMTCYGGGGTPTYRGVVASQGGTLSEYTVTIDGIDDPVPAINLWEADIPEFDADEMIGMAYRVPAGQGVVVHKDDTGYFFYALPIVYYEGTVT